MNCITKPPFQRHRRILPLPLCCLWLFPVSSAIAQDAEQLTHKLSLGYYASAGDYGAAEETKLRYIPLTYELSRFPWVLSLTVPHLSLDGPGDVFLETGNIGRGRAGANESISERALGDVVVTAGYQFDPIFNDAVFVDLTFQAKFPTADEEQDLGTGEMDTGVQLDFYRTVERNTWFSTIGYRHRGKTPLYDLEDTAFASVGYMRRTGDSAYLGLIYDYRERASSNSFESHELMPFYSLDLNTRWNVMLYTIVGFTDSSADKTMGLQFTYTLP